MFREEKPSEQPVVQAAPMSPGQSGMLYPGPGMMPNYPAMPGGQAGYCPYPGWQLAQVYIPIQPCGDAQFDLRKALEAGTLYPSLYQPYPR
ncbi:spore coat associated protein CotJA [Desulforamulus hydrothermalis]|uniref:Spore coat associated protein JA (CotJA) n=1 Tax=Desulforamulus hydrothermalis Lam5 = DSM 18033 TaxID=1121428 RepID=K8EHH7_9FIRM|nr:spore coat associated protein CotJA [Desulforamulus hydrothermalis]CCO08096.1 conserved hypothetical protein [Desulforamulus hydrothermalis Lam5 = DSM 18033]SHG82105.1 Spore coat associated protein JA (CotJA) [Desulforamulus hydrothermalis Lam5 = DSM 18033]